MKNEKIQEIVSLLLKPDTTQTQLGMAIDQAYGWRKIKWLPAPIAKWLERNDDPLNYEIAGMLIQVVAELRQRGQM
jgi:hypothetical protein